MKKFSFLILLIMCVPSFGQDKSDSIIDFEIIARLNGHISRSLITDKQGETFRGSVFSKEEGKMDFGLWENFYLSFSELFIKKYYHPDSVLSQENMSRLIGKDRIYKSIDNANKILSFSFTPIDFKNDSDSISFYFKTVQFIKRNSMGNYKYNFDVSFDEGYFKIPLNKATTLEFINKIFPDAMVQGVCSIRQKTPRETDEPHSKQSGKKLDLPPETSNLWIWQSGIVRSQKESQLGNTSFKLGLEYIETDKNKQEISFRKLSYPLVSVGAIPIKDTIFNLSNNIYSGCIIVPLKVGNKTKENKLNELGLLDKTQKEFYVAVIPISKKDDLYTLDVLVGTRMVRSNIGLWYVSRGKRIVLKLGDTIKLDIKYSRKMFLRKYGGYHIDLEEDYYKYYDEYLLFSLDKDK